MREHYEIDERQALFNAATAVNRLAMKSKRHPKTRAVLLAKADELREMALDLLHGCDHYFDHAHCPSCQQKTADNLARADHPAPDHRARAGLGEGE